MKYLWLLILNCKLIELVIGQNVVLQGFPKEDGHFLEWIVTECRYIDYFEIERKIDDSRFESIYTKQVKSYDCNGSYTYTFKEVPKGYKYEYRIKAYLETLLPVYSNTILIFYQPQLPELISIDWLTDTFLFSIIVPQTNQITVQILDILGRIVFQSQVEVNVGKHTIQFALDKIASGLYIVRLTDKKNRLLHYGKYVKW
ncbi:MAG: T9SS type A sorting domain-containing protein [Bacteroidia bacterium]|nr:T9SS type A sorting domain-containing protein [Bacteroidia bacterium]MDW8302375.1 T9SS type A sorting domain-containing protein [Bacteroidia bacterium]